MLETLKFSALLQKVGQMDPAVCWRSGRSTGPRVRAHVRWGWAHRSELAPGMMADFFLVNPFTAKAIPVHDPVATLVYSAGQANVETVVVDGKVLMEGGIFTHLDEAALLRETQRAAQHLAGIARHRAPAHHAASWRPV